MTEPSSSSEPSGTTAQRHVASARLRMVVVVVLLSALVVGLTDGLRDAVLAALLGITIAIVLDWMLLRPLRRLAASVVAFDATLASSPGAFESDESERVGELQQISHSLARVHHNFWQQLRDEQGRTAELKQEIERQQGTLRETQQALESKIRELNGMSRVDGLTGLANRREFEEALRREFRRAQRQRGLLALAVLDPDHFTAYNEQYGSASGDTALARLAQLLSIRFKRDTDLVARLGGAKFVALLPGFDTNAAQDLLEQVRQDLLAPQIPHDGAGTPAASGKRVLTVSIGLACYSPLHPYLNGQTLMQAADEALYIAKHAGRDRLSLAASGGTN